MLLFVTTFWVLCSNLYVSCRVTFNFMEQIFNKMKFLLQNSNIKLEHHHPMSSLVISSQDHNHLLLSRLSLTFQLSFLTRFATNQNNLAFSTVFCITGMFPRCIIPSITKLWHSLHNDAVNTKIPLPLSIRSMLFA